MLTQTVKKEHPKKTLRNRKDSKAHSPYHSIKKRIRTALDGLHVYIYSFEVLGCFFTVEGEVNGRGSEWMETT